MTLFRFEPFQQMQDYKEFMNNWVNNYPVSGTVNPAIDIYADKNTFYIEAEIPGFEKENIKLQLHENTLSISGEKKRENKEGNKYYSNERSFGSFKRTVTFPEDVNPDSCEAKFENGVLKIAVQKLVKPEFRERIINIK